MFRSFDPDDARGRLSGVYQGIGTATPLDTFAYNPDDTLGARTEGAGGGGTSTYGYDAIGITVTVHSIHGRA